MRRVLISGASRGIGNSIANRLIKDGHLVSLGVRNKYYQNNKPSNIEDTKSPIISNYDALDIKSAKRWVEKTVSEFGTIDTLIHCAGILKKTKLLFQEKEIKDIDILWKTNVMGPWILTNEVWKYLLENKEGRIIVLVSMSGKRARSNLAGYSMSKFALMSLCQTMRNEGWDQGLRVTAICPGWVNTDMAKEVRDFPKSEMTQPNDIASICSNLLTLPNSCIPFELNLNCNFEQNL